MSALQEIDPAEVEQRLEENDPTFAESLGLDPRYEPVVMEPVSGYGPIVDAWVGMQYPLNVNDEGAHGIIQGNGVRHARQYPDGSGVYETTAAGRLFAIRTAGGTVVWNSLRSRDPWPYGANPDAFGGDEINVPFAFVGEVLQLQTDLDMHREGSLVAAGSNGNVVEGDEFMRGVVRADLLDDPEEAGVLLEHKNGVQVYVGYDSTAHEHVEMFGFVPFDGDEGVRTPSANDALSLLTPNEAVVAEGRQGEWFLVPSDGEPEGTVQKPGLGQKPYGGSPLDNHVPRDWKTAVDDETFILRVAEEIGAEEGISFLFEMETPQGVFDAIHEGDLDLSYERARELAGGVYVRGTIRHRENEHKMEKADDWMQATTHDWDVVTVDSSTTNRSYRMD